jgi:hypothetical protein
MYVAPTGFFTLYVKTAEAGAALDFETAARAALYYQVVRVDPDERKLSAIV